MKRFVVYGLILAGLVALCGWNEVPVEALVSKCVAGGCLLGASRLAEVWNLLGEDW